MITILNIVSMLSSILISFNNATSFVSTDIEHSSRYFQLKGSLTEYSDDGLVTEIDFFLYTCHLFNIRHVSMLRISLLLLFLSVTFFQSYIFTTDKFVENQLHNNTLYIKVESNDFIRHIDRQVEAIRRRLCQSDFFK